MRRTRRGPAAPRWLARWVPGGGLGARQVPGLRTIKTTAAAVLAYVAAEQLGTSSQPVLASLTALLVVQLTMYETIAHGLQRVASVLSGVLLAISVAAYVGLTWWSLGVVVGVSLVVGLLLRLGPHLLEVPISAMLVLAVGGAEQAATGRVVETLVGAAAGILVNLVVAPPLHVRPAEQAMAELAERLAGFLRELAAQLRSDWSRSAADHWLNVARSLGAEVARADRSLLRAERSAQLNPRGASARAAQPRLRTALIGLEHSHVSLRGLCRALFDRTFFLPEVDGAAAYDPVTRAALADVLESSAEAMRAVGAVVVGAVGTTADPSGGPPADRARQEVARHLVEQRRRRDRLAQLLATDAHADQAVWQQHGALLAGFDRLRVEVEASVRPPAEGWRPALMTERQRRVVRRVRSAASQAAGELRPQLVRRRRRHDGGG